MEQKPWLQGPIFGIWWLIWCLCEGRFLHELSRYRCAAAFQSPKIHCYCFMMESRCFNTYSTHCVKRKAVKCLQILTNLNSSWRLIWCLAGDMFLPKKVSYRPMCTILSPTSLKYVHAIIMRRLRTYTTPLEPSSRTKNVVPGANFGRFDGLSGTSVRDNFVTNGLDTAMLMHPKVLNILSLL